MTARRAPGGAEEHAVEDTPSSSDQQTRTPASRPRMSPAASAGVSWGIWLGIGVAVIGFIVIAVGWGQVAGETRVWRQLPYIASAGVFGLISVVVGLAVLDVVTRRRDAAAHALQIAQLMTILEELREVIEQGDGS